jgi:hypothetical protein
VANEALKPLNEVAALIGVSKRALELRVKGGEWPALPATIVRGVTCVHPLEAYEHFVAHGRRKPAGLHRPAGYDRGDQAQPPAPAGIDPEIQAALGGDDLKTLEPHELMKRLAYAGVPESKVKTFVAVARELRGKKDSDLKAGKSFPPDDVVRMLRGLGDLFVEEIMAGEERCAAELLKTIRGRMGIDLAAKQTDAAIVLRGVLREALGDSVIKALRARIESDVNGVRTLEFQAP